MAVRFLLLCTLLVYAERADGQGKYALLIFDLSNEGGSFVLRNPIMVDSTNVASDMPSFHPKEPLIFYTSVNNDSSRICSFNYVIGEKKMVYGSLMQLRLPIVTPDVNFISFLEGDQGRLTLRKMPARSGVPTLISDDYRLESYQWIDDNSMLITIAGDPNSLMLMTLRPKRAIPVARNVGLVIHRTKDYLAFVHKLSVDSWSLKRINSSGSIELITHTLQETDRFAVTPEGRFLMAQENNLYYRGTSGWKQISLIGPKHIQQIISIAINLSGDKLLMVTELH